MSTKIFFFIIPFLYPYYSFGQSTILINDSTKNKLEEVIITGTKTERVLSSLPLNASIIKKEEIEKTNATRLSDIINEELGLITVSDFGGAEGLQMQGLDSEYILILIDNQPLVGRLAGTLDLNRISVGNVKQIEIVRGPSSSLYGNNAFAGVVNIITGDGTTGSLIVNHKDINKIAFTGSTQVGKLIQKSLAGRDVGLTLELGGKAANIVYEDAAIDQAVEGVVNGIFFNQGHVCCAGSRLLLQESIHDEFVAKLEKRMQTLRVGNPLDKNTDIGAINSKEQLNKIEGLVNEGVSDGGKIFQTECELPGNGFWFKPTLFTDVQPSYSIAREEIFGPVLTTLTFRTPQEAVEIANNTEYGLSAGVWTEKGSKILWTADRLQAGVVWANTFNKFDPSSPFGGYKESGFGREGGRQGLLSYLKAES